VWYACRLIVEWKQAGKFVKEGSHDMLSFCVDIYAIFKFFDPNRCNWTTKEYQINETGNSS